MDILKIKTSADPIRIISQHQKNTKKEAQPRGWLPVDLIEKTTLLWGEGRLNSLSTSHAMPLALWALAGPGLLCVPAETQTVRWRN